MGVKIVQDRKADTIWIGQPIYTEGILEKYGIKNCKSVATPADAGLKLTKGTEHSEYVEEKHYQSIVGSLLYISMRTCPDIAFAVSRAASFCSKPTIQHLAAVEHVLRYLRQSTLYGLFFKRNGSKSITGYCDPDLGGELLIQSPLLVIFSRLVVVQLSHGRVRSNPAQLCLQLKQGMWHWQELHKKHCG